MMESEESHTKGVWSYLKQLSIWDIAIIVYVIDTECKSIIKNYIKNSEILDRLCMICKYNTWYVTAKISNILLFGGPCQFWKKNLGFLYLNLSIFDYDNIFFIFPHLNFVSLSPLTLNWEIPCNDFV